MKENCVLQTERLKLREICEEDAEFIVSLRSDQEIYRFFLEPHRITLEEHLNWYHNRYLPDDNRYDWIGEDAAGNAVGVFGAKRVSANEAEVSYILDRSCYGRGLAREAVEAVMAFCVRYWDTQEVIAVIHKDNKDSIRFAVKLGLHRSEEDGDFLVYRRTVK